MEACNLSDADTDELLGISGIEPFASGGSVYVTPTKSPPGSPSELLLSSPKRRSANGTSVTGRSPGSPSKSPGRQSLGQSSPPRGRNIEKSPKRAVKKFTDSPGKLTLGDLKRKTDADSDGEIGRNSSRERLVHVRRYLENQELVQARADVQNKENLKSAGGACAKINSAPASGVKSTNVGGRGGKSLPSSPYKVDNVTVTSHHRQQVQASEVSWSDPNPPNKVPGKPTDPIFTYKRKLFQDDDNSQQNQKLKSKTVAGNTKKGQVLKDKSNKKSSPTNKQSPKDGVVHSGSPTQSTHCASKYKVSPRPSEGRTTARSPDKQQRKGTRSLSNSPEKKPSSIMKGSGSVSPGRRPGPVTFRKSPNNDRASNSSNTVSPPKHVKSPPQKKTISDKFPYTDQTSVYSKFAREPTRAMTQYSPEKYENGFDNTPATSGYHSPGKSPFAQDSFSNPLDEVLSQYPLSPEQGDVEISLPDSPGVKAAAATLMNSGEYDRMPTEAYVDVTSFDIEEMEGARDNLRNMLKLSSKNPELHLDLGGNNAHNESISTFRSYPDERYSNGDLTEPNDSFEEVATKALMGSRNEIDYEQAVQLTSQLLGRDREQREVPISTLEMENQVLLDNLEREKFRRQHCEKQIGNLQSRLLETQEQLAVAVSTEKKKDIMIEQLDKTLSRVVEGWKKREAEKKECIEMMKGEKVEIEMRYHAQKDMLEKFEEQLQKACKDLESERSKCAELEESKLAKLEQHEVERQQWAEAIDKERMWREQAEDERDRSREGLEHVQAQLDNLQITLDQERSDSSETENRLQKKITDLEETYRRNIENERKQVEDQTQLAQETREQLNATNIDLHKTRFDLETAMRERDKLKMELSLLEARMESSKRQLEADLTSEFEKALSDKMNEAHDRLVKTETDLRESHRKQIQELNQRHSDDMEEQMNTMTDDFKKKEAYLKDQVKTSEERLEEAQEEIRELKANKHKMELQRIEMASRMQSMMQTHCSEALSLLNSEDQPSSKSYQHESVLSYIPSMVDQTKSAPVVGAGHQSNNVVVEEGANTSPKLPIEGGVVVTRPNRVHHDDGAISDVLSTEGDVQPTHTLTSVHAQLIGGVQSTYVPPISIPHLSQHPINDVTSLDSNRSSNFGSASQVTSQYPYSSISFQPHIPDSLYQPSSTYSSIYEPISRPYTTSYSNGPIRSAFTAQPPSQPPSQPMRNNYTNPVGKSYPNQPISNGFSSQPIGYNNSSLTTSYANPTVVGSHMMNYPGQSHYMGGEPHIHKPNYNVVSTQRPPVVMEEVVKSDYSHLYNGNGNISEPSAPSLSSGYSSMANHSRHFSGTVRNGELRQEASKDETADVVSLLNGSSLTHNETTVGDISVRMEQHNQRQQELEHYVRMLLGKEPGIPVVSDEAEQNMPEHSPTQKHLPNLEQSQDTGSKKDGRLVSTAHAPKYGSVMGLAREKLHVKKKGKEDNAGERKSSVRKSRDGPVGKSAVKPWR